MVAELGFELSPRAQNASVVSEFQRAILGSQLNGFFF